MEKTRVAKAAEKSKPSTSYSTFFKKQDPPKFKGDCLDYLEFKRKWASQVSSHSPPSEFEIDLLKRTKSLYVCTTKFALWRWNKLVSSRKEISMFDRHVSLKYPASVWCKSPYILIISFLMRTTDASFCFSHEQRTPGK